MLGSMLRMPPSFGHASLWEQVCLIVPHRRFTYFKFAKNRLGTHANSFTDTYPYYQTLQNNSIANAEFLFWNGVKQVRDAVTKAGSTANVWVTETGWPINGNAKALATPGIDEAEMYWLDVACSAFAKINTFWFTFQDWSAVPSFAVIGQDSEVLYNLTC